MIRAILAPALLFCAALCPFASRMDSSTLSHHPSPVSAAPAAGASHRHTSPITAIIGAALIDGSGSPPIHNSIVLIQEGRILRAGPASGISIPPAADIINAHGKWLIPGLIDMHVHLDEVITPEMFVRYGVTSVRDMGSRLVTIQKWRAMPPDHAPHVYWMGRNIDEGKPSWWGAVAVKNVGEVPALLANMAKQGVDGVKLYVNAGPDVTRAVISEAHLRGWPVSAHLNNTMPSAAAEMGIDNLEHVAQLFIELKAKASGREAAGFGAAFQGVSKVDLNGPKTRSLLSALVEHHVAVTPTLSVSILPVLGEHGSARYYAGWSPVPGVWKREWSRNYWNFIKPGNWTTEQYSTAKRAGERFRQMVVKLYKAGVPLIAGTDTPAPWVLPGAGLLVELQLMVEAGVPPAEVIHAATGRAAELLHRTDDVGEIAAGRIADMVLLDADPIKDIGNLHKIDAVYLNGLRCR